MMLVGPRYVVGILVATLWMQAVELMGTDRSQHDPYDGEDDR